jgi:formate hydrogenlyase transcriptional activator
MLKPEFQPSGFSSIAERYEWLIGITTLIRAQKEPQPGELFDIFVRELSRVVQFDALAKFDEASDRVDWYFSPVQQQLEEACREIAKLDEDEKLLAWVYKHQETIVLGTLDQARFPASMRIMRQAGLQSVCAFPLSDPHRRLGSMVIACVRRDAYSPEQVRFCALVANQIALAMDDAINFRASQRARKGMELLLDLTNRVVSKLNLRDVLREISANIRRVMQCDGVGIALPGPEDQKLRIYALDFPEHPSEIEEGRRASSRRPGECGESVPKRRGGASVARGTGARAFVGALCNSVAGACSAQRPQRDYRRAHAENARRRRVYDG